LCREQQFPSGQMNLVEVAVQERRTLHAPGDADVSGLQVRSGIVGLFKLGPNGHSQITSLRYSGELVEPEELRVGYGAKALTKCVLACMSPEQFDGCFGSNEDSRSTLSRARARQQRIAMEWVFRSSLNSSARLAHLWCECQDRLGIPDGEVFQLPFSQAQMAEITGQTPINVNRVVGSWSRQGLIDERSGPIQVDWAMLRRIGSFNPLYLR